MPRARPPSLLLPLPLLPLPLPLLPLLLLLHRAVLGSWLLLIAEPVCMPHISVRQSNFHQKCATCMGRIAQGSFTNVQGTEFQYLGWIASRLRLLMRNGWSWIAR